MNVIFVLEISLLITSVAPRHNVPPKPRHEGNVKTSSPHAEVGMYQFDDPINLAFTLVFINSPGDVYSPHAERVASWSPEDKNNAWELSGQFEGDIMLYENADIKNALQDDNARWPKAVIPYFIDKVDFSQEDQDVISEAFKEYHMKTCVKFRPYKEDDEDFITIQGKQSGCWSFVGRHGGGQVVNLQNPGCLHHGIIIHELLHALGFYHQQSAHERDDYVKINWENIKMGKEHNFRKYGEATVTNFGVEYDYGSIMHYSAYAFSKNGNPTITPLKNGTTIGQREGLSVKDIKKIGKMYGCFKCDDDEECDEKGEENPDIEEEEEYLMLLPRVKPVNRL